MPPRIRVRQQCTKWLMISPFTLMNHLAQACRARDSHPTYPWPVLRAMKPIALLAALWFCAAATYAQITVTGTVLEDETTPATFANVVLVRSTSSGQAPMLRSGAADYSFVAGAVTDDAGKFLIAAPDAPAGEYRLRVTSIGFADLVTAGFGVSPNGTLNRLSV